MRTRPPSLLKRYTRKSRKHFIGSQDMVWYKPTKNIRRQNTKTAVPKQSGAIYLD